MTIDEIFSLLKDRFTALKGVQKLMNSDELIHVHTLSTDDILGTAERKDFPILGGKEIIQQGEFLSGSGQAFTSRPVECALTIRKLLSLPLNNIENQGVFVAGINAVMNHLGLTCNNIHCKDDGPEMCGRNAAAQLMDNYGDIKVTLVGYQPCLFANLSNTFTDMRVTDLGADKVGSEHYGRTVEHGITDRESACDWADLILCTGSTLTNGTFADYYNYALEGRNILFYGTTLSGAAVLLGLSRMCYADNNGRK